MYVWPESDLAHSRVQPVSADDQIHFMRRRMIEADYHRPLSLRDAVAEDRLYPTVQ